MPELLFLRWGIRHVQPQCVLEIGSYCGASTAIIADTLQSLGRGRVVALDLFASRAEGEGHPGPYHEQFDETLQPYAGWYEKLEGHSQAVPWSWDIDLLFIDGDHTEAGAYADIERFAPWVRSGGFVYVHDCIDVPETNSMVMTAVERSLLTNPAYHFLGYVGSLIAFRKRAA